MTEKQDRQGARTPAALEQRYKFGKSFAEVMGLANDAQTSADAAREEANKAKQEATNLDNKLTSEEIFKRLTNDGTSHGLYRDAETGDLYINGQFIQAGTFKSTASVYIEPGVEEFETVKDHILGKATIPSNRVSLYDADGNGSITITDMTKFKSAMLGKESIASWPNAVKSTVTVTIDASNQERSVKISGTNMWGRAVEYYIGLLGGNIGLHDGSLAVSGMVSVGGGVTLYSANGRDVVTGLTSPVDGSDAVNKEYLDRLGIGTPCVAISSWNDALVNGCYKSNKDAPDGYWWWGEVIAYADNSSVVQHLMRWVDNNLVHVCRAGSKDAWGEWEWVNPPDNAGTEYRTTEGYGGRRLYRQSFDFGALPNNTSASIPTGIPAGWIVRMDGYGYNQSTGRLPFPLCDSTGAMRGFFYVDPSGSLIVRTFDNRSNWTGRFTLWYIKV